MSALLSMLIAAAGDVDAGTVAISNLTASAAGAFGPVEASYSLQSSGFLEATGQGILNWISPQTGMALFEVRASSASNPSAITQGTLDTWQGLATTRTWAVSVSSGSASTTLFIEIRRASDAAVVSSATITLAAEVQAGPPPP